MKKSALFIAALIISHTIAASLSYACERNIDDGRILCPGDRIVSPTNNTGKVIGINSYQRMVSVDLDYYSDNYSYPIENVFIGFGCMYEVCVGDRVVSPTNITGTVIGINPYKQTVSIDLDYYSDHYSYRLEDIFLGYGCVKGICVKDKVISPSNITGDVIGINPYYGKVSIDLDNYSDHYSYYITSIYLTNECLDYGPDYRSRSQIISPAVRRAFNFFLKDNLH